jgi:Protein of unknown function (DUF5661)
MTETPYGAAPSPVEAAEVAAALGIDWLDVPFDLAQFRAGLAIELERAREAVEIVSETATDSLGCGRIVLARLVEKPDYYRALAPWGPDGERTAPP